MTKKETAKFIAQIIVSIASAILTDKRPLGMTPQCHLGRPSFYVISALKIKN